MSQKRVKQFRKVTKAMAKELRSDIEESVIRDMMSEKLGERLRIAWKIIRRKVKDKRNEN